MEREGLREKVRGREKKVGGKREVGGSEGKEKR